MAKMKAVQVPKAGANFERLPLFRQPEDLAAHFRTGVPPTALIPESAKSGTEQAFQTVVN
jgi:hypothetical protein